MNIFQHNHFFNPLNAELNLTCHLLALLGAHHIFHVSRIRVNKATNPVFVRLQLFRPDRIIVGLIKTYKMKSTLYYKGSLNEILSL
jgi:hypothetical protein